MRIVDDHEVSESEKITRFIFGAILGFVLSLISIYQFELSSAVVIAILAGILVFGCGYLALVQGDRFWIKHFGNADDL
jgi:uncharacterized membrane protein YgaE (UPF0421/DUF939 family)